MFGKIRQLSEMIRFSHTLFALPFALLAAVMAWGANFRETGSIGFRFLDLAGILVCMATARAAAMAFNRLADRRIDALNPRTEMRHLPTGRLSVGGVAAFTVICSLLFIAGTLLFLPHNWLPLYASVPVLVFLLGYSHAKRFTLLAHVWLGTALALAPVAAWVALRGQVAWPPVILGLAVLFWVTGFDIIYACQDAEFDVEMRLKSVPARFGIATALRLAALSHLGMLAMLVLLAVVFPEFGWVYLGGLAVIAALLAYEHWLVSPDSLDRVNRAFFHVNAIISVGLLLLGVIDVMTGRGL